MVIEANVAYESVDTNCKINAFWITGYITTFHRDRGCPSIYRRMHRACGRHAKDIWAILTTDERGSQAQGRRPYSNRPDRRLAVGKCNKIFYYCSTLFEKGKRLSLTRFFLIPYLTLTNCWYKNYVLVLYTVLL